MFAFFMYCSLLGMMANLNKPITAPRPGSRRVVTTSRDNTLRIWDGKADMAQAAVMQHNNNTGRWVIPFRAVWGPASDCLIVGNMKRMVLLFFLGFSMGCMIR